MVIGEYLDRSEPNPFMQICSEASDGSMGVVYDAIGDKFTNKTGGESSRSFATA